MFMYFYSISAFVRRSISSSAVRRRRRALFFSLSFFVFVVVLLFLNCVMCVSFFFVFLCDFFVLYVL